ncbi:MAG: DUF4190 domain-containing protein [Fimbriimonadaceae bacterium]|jgi:hypothetical protein|nr:DUF4190 domain-containing protein [Fimbriimonadaceae bacterium]
MQYFVIWTDGSKFGPATIETLNQWASEGRISADTELESVTDGSRIKAGSLPGFAGASPAAQPQVTQTPEPMTPAAAIPSTYGADPVSAAPAATPARYFVVSSTGEKYGPADTTTLQSWIEQGRLTSTSQLEEEGTGRTMMAMSVAGLNFAIAQTSQTSPFQSQPTETSSGAGYNYGSQPSNPYAQSPTPTNYPRYQGGNAFADEEANKLATWSIVLGILSFVLCGIFASIPGLICGYKAREKGAANAKIGLIINWISIGLNVIGLIFFVIMFMIGMGSAAASGSF